MKLTLTQRRIIAGALLPVFLVTLANSVFDLNLFGDYDRKVFGGVLGIGLVWFLLFAPDVEELKENRRRKRAERAGAGDHQ